MTCTVCGINNKEESRKCHNCKARLFVSTRLKKQASETHKIGAIGALEIVLYILTFILPVAGWIIGVIFFIIYLFQKPKIAYIFLIIAFASLVMWGLIYEMADAYMKFIS